MKYATEMAPCGMIYQYITGFMKTATSVTAILKSGLRNLRGCNVGITNVRDL
jgi:hypothetical protein